MLLRKRKWRQSILVLLLVAWFSRGFCKATDNDNDDLGKKIEEEGQSIDKVSSMIEHSTENMEDEIEKAGEKIDSPDAEKRIMVAGKKVDDLAEEMEKETELKGQMIERFMQSTEKESGDKLTKEVEKGAKHEEIGNNKKEKEETAPDRRTFERQENLRQKLEDLVEIQGKKVEAIGNEMEKSRRNLIRNDKRKQSRSKVQQRTARNQRSHEKVKVRLQDKVRKFKNHGLKYVNKNATKRRVIIPVNRGKLKKLMLYYYINDKIKNGELNSHNLAKFFDHIKQLSLDDKESQNKGKGSDKLEFTKDEEEKKANQHGLEKDTSDLKDILSKFLNTKNKEDESNHLDEQNEKEPSFKSIIELLESKGEAKGSTPVSTADDDTADIESLKNTVSKKEADDKSDVNGNIFTNDQVHKMLDKIKMINATIFQMEKKKKKEKEKSSKKKCLDSNCVGRALITLLDDALHAVKQEKTEKVGGDLNLPVVPKAIKEMGQTRSKSDPYAGIGFAETQEKTGEADGESTGSERHLSPHGVDVIGTNDHRGYFGGSRGYHGHTMPIRTNHHHDEHGYVEPLNVDTAPMPHYPDRHVHDHLDVDTLLRGHPFNYHHHTPDVALEGPISTSSVYDDMHHMLNGPGIHDQPDVHYEVEMHAHPYHHETHHEDDHEDNDEHGDHGDDEYQEDDYHEGHNGNDHENNLHGDKKHTIEKAKKKTQFKRKTAKKAHKVNKINKKKRERRHENEDEDDDDDDDVRVEKVPRNGHGVARLSYLTQKNGEDMEHEINEGILDVEDVGRSIEEKVQRGVDRVTEISNHDVEAPDYDSEGHMEPTIHREDIEESGDD
eukprot:gene13810-4739_t